LSAFGAPTDVPIAAFTLEAGMRPQENALPVDPLEEPPGDVVAVAPLVVLGDEDVELEQAARSTENPSMVAARKHDLECLE
jgi:hypothetical protein